MSASLPFEILQKFKGDFEVFFETGTNEGDSTQTALEAGFKKIYTVEYNEEIFRRASQRFSTHSNVVVLNSSSVEALRTVLPTIEEPVLFFLDAHPDCSAGLTPVLEELEVIKDYKFPVRIMIDDMRLMGKGNWSSISIPRIIESVEKMDSKLVIDFVENAHENGDLLVAF